MPLAPPLGRAAFTFDILANMNASSKSAGAEQKKRDKAMEAVKRDIIALKSALADERRKNGMRPVMGAGSHLAELLFVGEAPGKNEAIKAVPFCGASGKFLDVLIGSIGLRREDVYITNLVNDRPTDNRDPLPDEIGLYSQFLDRILMIIKPKTIVTLGRLSMAYVMKKYGLENEIRPISQIHGKIFKGKSGKGALSRPVSIICLYHPAYALYNGSKKGVLLEDFQSVKKTLGS